MNDINNLPTDVPDVFGSFQIDITGEVTKKRFLGDFSCKIPTIKDQSLISKHTAMLNGDFPSFLEPGIVKIHKMLAYLRYTLTDYPSFWKNSDLGFELRDKNVIETIYDEVLTHENNWLTQIWGEAQNESTDSKES